MAFISQPGPQRAHSLRCPHGTERLGSPSPPCSEVGVDPAFLENMIKQSMFFFHGIPLSFDCFGLPRELWKHMCPPFIISPLCFGETTTGKHKDVPKMLATTGGTYRGSRAGTLVQVTGAFEAEGSRPRARHRRK